MRTKTTWKLREVKPNDSHTWTRTHMDASPEQSPNAVGWQAGKSGSPDPKPQPNMGNRGARTGAARYSADQLAMLDAAREAVAAHDHQSAGFDAAASACMAKCMRKRNLLPLLVQSCERDGLAHHTLETILSSSARPGWRRRDVAQALRTAVTTGCGGCIESLCNRVDPNRPYRHGMTVTPVLDAANRGDAGVGALRALLASGAAPEPFAPRCWPSALHLAVRANSLAAVRLLLDHGAPLDTVSPVSGCTAAMLAADMNRHTVARALLEHAVSALKPPSMTEIGSISLWKCVAAMESGQSATIPSSVEAGRNSAVAAESRASALDLSPPVTTISSEELPTSRSTVGAAIRALCGAILPWMQHDRA